LRVAEHPRHLHGQAGDEALERLGVAQDALLEGRDARDALGANGPPHAAAQRGRRVVAEVVAPAPRDPAQQQVELEDLELVVDCGGSLGRHAPTSPVPAPRPRTALAEPPPCRGRRAPADPPHRYSHTRSSDTSWSGSTGLVT